MEVSAADKVDGLGMGIKSVRYWVGAGFANKSGVGGKLIG
jgi:hypothetical protein